MWSDEFAAPCDIGATVIVAAFARLGQAHMQTVKASMEEASVIVRSRWCEALSILHRLASLEDSAMALLKSRLLLLIE